MNEEVVVKFQSEKRRITMYFSQNEGELQMSMEVYPEFDPENEESPDLSLLLASTLMNALNTENRDDAVTEVYAGED